MGIFPEVIKIDYSRSYGEVVKWFGTQSLKDGENNVEYSQISNY